MPKARNKDLCQLEKLLSLQDLTVKHYGRWLTKHLSFAIKHLPEQEELIFKVFKQCVLLLPVLKRSTLFRNKISCMLGCQPKSKWTTFLDKLRTCEDPTTLTMYLLKTLGQALISKEKACQPYWKPVYKETSVKLLLPTETDSVALDMNSWTPWSQRQVVKSPFLTVRQTKQVSKSLPTTCLPSYMSSLVSKWENEATANKSKAPKKTVVIRIYPNSRQKKLLDEYIDTSRYVYNRTLETIKDGHKVNWQHLRDMLVTSNTKKGFDEYKVLADEIKQLQCIVRKTKCDEEKAELQQQVKLKRQELRTRMKEYDYVSNPMIKDFELKTPKDIRCSAVKQVCDAYKSGFTNLQRGHIKFFDLKYRKKTNKKQTIEMTPKNISMIKGVVTILPETFKQDKHLKISRRNVKKHKNLVIKNNVDLVRKNGFYHLYILEDVVCASKVEVANSVTGIDLGLRTFATACTVNADNTVTITEYEHRRTLLRKLNNKVDAMKAANQSHRKKQYTKIERRKTNIVDAFHWDFINDVLNKSDIVFLGDIKSHDIVKGSKNPYVNREFNDIKFFVLKQRMAYKAKCRGKLLALVPEQYTTKCCSCCGHINTIGDSKEFHCTQCHFDTGRDINASKNILLKGIHQ